MGVVLIGEFEIGVWACPVHLYYKCETCNKCRGCPIASLREGGGPRSGGRSLRDFEFRLTL